MAASSRINNTIRSQDQHRVIIIKPTGNNAEDLINNPFLLNKEMKSSSFAQATFADIRINKRKKIIVLELSERSDETLDKLLKEKKLGNYDIESYTPNRDKYKAGVIGPISVHVTTEEIKEALTDYKVISVDRLKKKVNNNWIDSTAIKLTFETSDIPADIKIEYSYYKVRPFVHPPLQCYNCQRIGHTASTCNTKTRCMLCGGEHEKKDCKSLIFKCAGCGGEHKSNDKACPIVKRACQVEKRRAHGETYMQAYQAMSNKRGNGEDSGGRTEGNGLQQQVTIAEVHHRMQSQVGGKESNYTTYSDIAKINVQKEVRRKTAEERTEIQKMIKEEMTKSITTLADYISECLIQVFTSSVMKENDANKRLIISNIVTNCVRKTQCSVSHQINSEDIIINEEELNSVQLPIEEEEQATEKERTEMEIEENLVLSDKDSTDGGSTE